MRKTTCFLALLCVLALLLGVIPVTYAAETYILPVFETSDIHGSLLDTSSTQESTYQYYLAYIADKVDDVRGGDNSRTVLLDGGDIYQGNVISNIADGEPLSAAFDAMEYDAVALGNHEFDWGIEKTTDSDGTMPDYHVNGKAYENKIPIVCSNLYYRSSNQRVEFTKDYVILNKTAVTASGATMQVKIAVIGYVPNYSSSIMTSRFQGYYINSGIYAVENLAKNLKSSGQADAAILLAHEDAKEIAGSLSSSTAFDLVCGGHSHTENIGTSGSVTYIQPWANGSGYARADLCFDSSKKVTTSGQVGKSLWYDSSHTYDTAANKSYLAPDVLELSHYFLGLESIHSALHTPLGYITTSVNGNAIGDNPRSSTGGNWMTDLANRATGAKVSFTNSGGIRTSFNVSGGRKDIMMGDVYSIAPFGNLLYVYEVTYPQLLELLQYGVSSGLDLRMSGVDCYYTDKNVTAIVEDGVCIYKNGKWLEEYQTKKIRVSANEFIATSSGTAFNKLNSTCLVDHSMVDNESFVRVLEKERDSGNGLLYVDPNPHYINGTYNGDINVKYTITTSYEGKGTVTPSATVDFGSKFVVSFRPDDGWEMTSLVVDGTKYSPRESFTFGSVTASHTVHVVFTEKKPVEHDCPCDSYSDLDGSKWYHEGVDYALENGLMNGVGDGKFDPNGSLTRAMLVTILYRAEDEPGVAGERIPFADVPDGQWYTDAIIWAAGEGIVNGVSETSFAPNMPITREQIAAILYRYAGEPSFSGSLSAFSDAQSVSAYAYDAMIWAVAEGIIGGSGNQLTPKENATRAQIATILYRYLEA